MLKRLDQLLAGVPLHPFLFASYVVLQLYVNNLAEVPPADVVPVLVVVLALTAVLLGLAWLGYRDLLRAAVLVAVTMMLLLGFGHVRAALMPLGFTHGVLMLVVALLLVLLVAFAAARIGSSLAPLTQALNLVSVVLLVVAIIPVGAFARDALRVPADLALEAQPAIDIDLAAVDETAPARDIYYLVLDRYGSEQALGMGHGLDNSEFSEWLREQGFDVVDGARANYVRSTLSLASALSMNPLDDIVAGAGSASRTYGPLIERIRKSRAAAFLQGQGYRYIHIGSWFDPSRESDIADVTLVPEAHIDFASTVLDLSAARVLLDEFAPQTGYGGLHATAARYQLEQLERLASEPGPKLVIAHVLLPHAPYVFLEDGTYSPAEASLETQLAFTNARLRAWLEPLLALPEDERPIVILQADEGPYPDRYAADGDAFDWSTATPEEVTQKFGILTAMYLPGSPGVESVSPTMSPVNTFRYVLRRYFAADLPHLPDRSFTSSYERPYDLLEVSDRVVPPDDP